MNKFLSTKNEHFKYGFNNVPKALRRSVDDTFFISYGKCDSEVSDFLTECINAIKHIRDNTEKTLYFTYSGGIDSEMMCFALINSNITNYKILICDYKNNNSHDLDFAFDFCRQFNIDPYIFSFDVLDFWKSADFLKITEAINCSSPQYPVYMKIMQHVNEIGGLPILGNGDPFFEKNNNQLVSFELELAVSLYRFLDVFGYEGVPSFFQYTPELLLSWITDDFVFEKMMAMNELENNVKSGVKYLGYKKFFNSMKERKKFTGFEQIQNMCNDIRSERTKFLNAQNAIHKLNYHDMIQMLSKNV